MRFTNEKWMIYTKLGCSSCEKAVKLLEQKNILFDKKIGVDKANKVIEEVDKKMKEINKEDFKTWPKIFDNKGEFVGGFIDLEKKFNE